MIILVDAIKVSAPNLKHVNIIGIGAIIAKTDNRYPHASLEQESLASFA